MRQIKDLVDDHVVDTIRDPFTRLMGHDDAARRPGHVRSLDEIRADLADACIVLREMRDVSQIRSGWPDEKDRWRNGKRQMRRVLDDKARLLQFIEAEGRLLVELGFPEEVATAAVGRCLWYVQEFGGHIRLRHFAEPQFAKVFGHIIDVTCMAAEGGESKVPLPDLAEHAAGAAAGTLLIGADQWALGALAWMNPVTGQVSKVLGASSVVIIKRLLGI